MPGGLVLRPAPEVIVMEPEETRFSRMPKLLIPAPAPVTVIVPRLTRAPPALMLRTLLTAIEPVESIDTVNPDGMVTVFPTGMITVSVGLGTPESHVAALFQFPLVVAVTIVACASWIGNADNVKIKTANTERRDTEDIDILLLLR